MPQNMNYPGVYRQEIDDTSYATVNNSTYIAVMGKAKTGPSGAKVLVNSQQQLISTFGTPIVSGSYPSVSAIDYGIYAGLEALKETQNLWYVRNVVGNERYSNVEINATIGLTSGGSVTINAVPTATVINTYPNGNTPTDIFDLKVNAPAISGVFRVASIGPGSYGDNIAVRIETSATYTGGVGVSSTPWFNSYDDKPNTTSADQVWNKVFKVSVYQKQSYEKFDSTMWTSISGSPVEIFYCSTVESLQDNSGNSMFIEDVINGNSKYIYAVCKDLNGTLPGNTTTYLPLTGGKDDLTSDIPNVWGSLFGNRDTTPVDIIVSIPTTKNEASSDFTSINDLVSSRYDFIAVGQMSKLTDTTFVNIQATNNAVAVSNPSYFAKYVGWNLVFDQYNSCRVMLPNAIYAASTMARVDRLANPWEAPAGQDYGVIPSGRQNLSITPLLGGQLYDLNLNTVKFVRGVGSVVWGQKTAQLKKTYRDRINVRRILLYIEKNVEQMANAYMFKGNTPKLREKLTSEINSFLQTIRVKGGLEKFKVVCDTSNNPQSSIDAHILNVGVYVMPVQTIEYILITTTVTNSGVVFSEAGR